MKYWCGVVLTLVLLVGLVAARPSTTCDPSGTRIDCGFVGINQTQCEAQNCCWTPVDPNPGNLPWCYYDSSGQICDGSQPRTDCGFVGINQTQCEGQGCCWDPVNPNPNNLPWCFDKVAAPKVYNLTSINQTEWGFMGFLVLEGNNPSTSYGPTISPLLLNVSFEAADRVHIKITDARNQRWEIPDRILPRPGFTNPSSLNYNVTYTTSPFSIRVTRISDGAIIFDTSVGQLLFVDQYLEISTVIGQQPNIYGLGEHREPLQLPYNNHIYTMWTRDSPTPVDQNAYGSHPFYLEVRPGGNAHGVFLLNTNGMDVVLNPGMATFRVIGGVLDFYIFDGPTPEQVTEQFHQTIGTPHMPAYWSLGWHQCRYGYPNIYYVEQVVANYSAAQIPLDTIWNDIDHMYQYQDFTFDPNNYPVSEVQRFVTQLHNNGQQYVLIVDPGIHNVAGYPPYDQGKQANIFVKQSDGQTDFVGAVWPGSTVFPDFYNPNSLQYWFNQIEAFLDLVPTDGLWIDMNEASNFNDGQPTSSSPYNNPPYKINNWGSDLPLNHKTLAMDCLHYGGIYEYNAHNTYGFTEAIATNAALEKYYGRRSFVLARSTFSGAGKHTAHWTGDNFSNFDSMTSSITQILAFNLYGVPLVGADICGFLGNTNEELCARWSALGAFYPFARNHNDINSIPQEPYLWPIVAEVARKTLAARYSLLPYYYSLFYKAHTVGGTVARSLIFEFSSDANTYTLGQQFMIGPALMISPVLTQGATSVNMYFPEALWYDFWTHILQPMNGMQNMPAALDQIQVHIRGGYIIPMQFPAMTTRQTRTNPFKLVVPLDNTNSASGYLFWDDGLDLNVGGEALQVSFSLSKQQLSSTVLQSNYPNSIPNLSTILFLGAPSNVSSVQYSVAGGQFVSTPFTYNSTSHELAVSNLALDLTQPFTVVYA